MREIDVLLKPAFALHAAFTGGSGNHAVTRSLCIDMASGQRNKGKGVTGDVDGTAY
ncbi:MULTISPECIES: hypothetical protein [Laceyella]|jgi:hypothetical protein|uniref:hypothetical protein n=1 Tax=Laceyella TaxID=292635 RepID=UPI0012B8D7DA|nr:MULTISPECIES: hypothetical protein [Laceyella]MRG28977.1 hypothetical protein [Laceyella tengchongensis]